MGARMQNAEQLLFISRSPKANSDQVSDWPNSSARKWAGANDDSNLYRNVLASNIEAQYIARLAPTAKNKHAPALF